MKNKIVQKLLKDLPSDIKQDLIANKAMIAGGALLSIVKNHQINDYDIYFKSRGSCYKFISEIPKSYALVSKTNRSAVFAKSKSDLKFNVIYFDVFENLQHVFSFFDYETCKIGYDFETNKLETGERFWSDAVTNTLTYSGNTKYPLGALIRIQKYVKKGYNIDTLSLLKLINDLVPLKNKPVDEIIDQLTGMYGLSIKPENVKNFDEIISFYENNEVVDNRGEYIGDKVEWDDVFADIFKFYKISRFPNGGITMIDDKVVSFGYSYKLDAQEMVFPLKLYKRVNNDGTSHYMPSFVYKVKEYAEDKKNGLFFVFDKTVDNGYKNGGAILEAIVDRPEDIKDIRTNTIIVYKCFVNSITPMSDMNVWEIAK
jgi:hypothetical protein